MTAKVYEFKDGQVILCADGRYPAGSICIGEVPIEVFVLGNGKPDETAARFRGVVFRGCLKRGTNPWLYPPDGTPMSHRSFRNERIYQRLEYLRGEISAERISYAEIAELMSLASYIKPDDTLLLEWAGIPEFPEAK